MSDVLKVDEWIDSKNAQFEFCDNSLQYVRRLNDGIVFGIHTLLQVDVNFDNGDDHYVYYAMNKFHDDKIHVTIKCVYICNNERVSEYVEVKEINDVKYGH